MESVLSTTEVQALSGLTYRKLDWYVRRGLLNPEGAFGGSGTVRRWSEHDALVASALGDLFRLGIKGRAADRAAAALAELTEDEFSGTCIVRQDGTLRRHLPYDRLSTGWVLDLSEVRARVRMLTLVPA